MREFERWVLDLLKAINERGEVLTLAHLAVGTLEQRALGDRGRAAANELRAWLRNARIQPGRKPPIATFDTRQAADSFEATASADADLSVGVLRWLLTSDFTDETSASLRASFDRHGLTALTLTDGSPVAAGALGFGAAVDRDWLARVASEGPLEGRSADLDRHLGFLTAAVTRGRPYVLEGQAGVGKSLFIRALLRLASERWSTTTDRALREARFLMLTPRDFSGPESEVEERLQRLHDHLRAQPRTVPVFDGLEALLRGTRGEAFEGALGGLVSGACQAIALVGRTAAVTRAELLRDVRPVSLAPLRVEATTVIVRRRLDALCKGSGLVVDGEADVFCNGLVRLASDRYPGRYFPEVALHLVESVAARALNRTAFLKLPPEGRITENDLREHVSEEQGINTEALGKDSRAFYSRVAEQLREDVRGQDHVIDQVCRALLSQAHAPPRATPRGRFLFVGPPGVGKTHLARSLARRLGLGDEAFFVFNMSEYSSESARTRFMGSDPGYVGYKSTRTIYDLVRARPSCVVLLDEVDRADPAIQDILLSLLEGQGKDSEGELVHFSQAIFVLTTNQGQEQVSKAYQEARAAGGSRESLVATFDDSQLRRLLLEGVVGDAELHMKRFLEERLTVLQRAFKALPIQQAGDDEITEVARRALAEYQELQERRSGLELRTRRAQFDRAFLDRIDFVLPFFPIKERDLLEAIRDQALAREGWADCPEATKARIVEEAMQETESVRPLERLVKKYGSERFELVASPPPRPKSKASKRPVTGA